VLVLVALGCAPAGAQEAGRVGVTMESPVAFGGQYLLGNRFGIFGEVGLSGGHTNSSSTSSGLDLSVVTTPGIPGATATPTSPLTTKTTTVGTRTAVGDIFYF